jgi:hypothetical protein
MPKRPTSCVYCGGPLPPPALTGRPRSFCSAQCREANEQVVVSRHREEKERREREQREAEATARRKKADAARERAYKAERRRILAAGGEDAFDLLQREAFKNERCGWYDDDQETLEVCLRPTDRETFVWCKKHNRQLEREAEQRRKGPEVPEESQERPRTPVMRESRHH